jgi:DNA-binding LytR/AlgR family response regulator
MQNFFFIRTGGKYIKLNLCELLYVEAQRNYLKVVTNKTSYFVLCKMKQMEDILPVSRFCRVHRSFIVSIEQICSFDTERVYYATNMFPLGDRYKEKLHQRITIVQNQARAIDEKTIFENYVNGAE